MSKGIAHSLVRIGTMVFFTFMGYFNLRAGIKYQEEMFHGVAFSADAWRLQLVFVLFMMPCAVAGGRQFQGQHGHSGANFDDNYSGKVTCDLLDPGLSFFCGSHKLT